MKYAGLIVGFLAFLFPVSVLAERVTVRSGEHDGFSRIVLDFPDETAWTLDRVDGGYELRTQTAGWQFDLSDVFRLIPRTRIADLAALPDGKGLKIGLACGCEILAFEARPNAIAIDVKDPVSARSGDTAGTSETVSEPPTSDRLEMEVSEADIEDIRLVAGIPQPGVPTGSAGVFRPPVLWGPARPDAVADPPGDGFLRASETSPALRLPRPPIPSSPGLTPDRLPESSDSGPASLLSQPDGARAPDSEALARVLAAQMARAATQGILKADVASAAAFPVERDDEPTPPPNLRIRPPGGAAGFDALVDGPSQPIAPGCVASSRLDIASWGAAETGASASLADMRRDLVGEFDEADPEAALRLSRFYLSLGFGAEAAATLKAFVGAHSEAELLGALASVMDETPSVPPPILANQAECPGRIALWAVLSGAVSPSAASSVDRTSLLAALDELPIHLRRHLGPRLADTLLKWGDEAAAESVRRQIARAPGPHGDAFDMLEAQIAAETLPGGQGLSRLREEATGASDLAPEALVLLLEKLHARDEVADEALIEVAAVRAFELRGSATGDRLSRELVRALVRRGDYAAAFERIERQRSAGYMQETTAAILVEEGLLDLVHRAPDEVFFHFGTGFDAMVGPGLTPGSAGPAMAERFLALGFPALARASLDRVTYDTTAHAELRARLYLEEGDPNAALAVLEHMAEPSSDLRAQALAAVGRHDEAAEEYLRIGDIGRGLSEAWRAGDWERIADDADDARSAVAELVLEARANAASPDAVTEDDPLTGSGPRLVQKAADTRTRIEAILSQFARP